MQILPEHLRLLATKVFLFPALTFGMIYQWCSKPWMLLLAVSNINLRRFCSPWRNEALVPSDCDFRCHRNCLIYVCIQRAAAISHISHFYWLRCHGAWRIRVASEWWYCFQPVWTSDSWKQCHLAPTSWVVNIKPVCEASSLSESYCVVQRCLTTSLYHGCHCSVNIQRSRLVHCSYAV